MRHRAARINRAWLAVIGVVLILAGAAVGLIALGLAAPLFTMADLGSGPKPGSSIIGSGLGSLFGQTLVILAVILVGVILAVLALAWLAAQIPRTDAARTFRLQDDAARGLTSCSPKVLTDAVEQDARELAGVSAATAVIRGTAQQPELTLRITADDRTDLPDLLRQVESEVAGNLSHALQTPLRRLAVQLDITPLRQTSNSVSL